MNTGDSKFVHLILLVGICKRQGIFTQVGGVGAKPCVWSLVRVPRDATGRPKQST